MTHALNQATVLAQNAGDLGAGGELIVMIVYLALIVLIIASLWVIFTKAGKPGWAAIVPFYNLWVLVEICGKSPVWFVLLLIPCVNIIVNLILMIDLARVFGKGAGFGLGLFFLGIIFFPILAFGDAQYQGPTAGA